MHLSQPGDRYVIKAHLYKSDVHSKSASNTLKINKIQCEIYGSLDKLSKGKMSMSSSDVFSKKFSHY